MSNQTINYNWQYSNIFEPVFDWNKRYIALTGGRACVDGNTVISTPNGEIKIKDFKGGLIYSFDGNKRIVTYACKPMVYKAEDLYTVKTNKRNIIVTANHRFLTDRGWVKTNQLCIDRDNLVCVSFDKPLTSQDLLQSTLESCLSTFEQGVQSYLQSLLGFLYCCLQDYHLCDAQLLQGLNTYQDVLPLLIGVTEHMNPTSNHMDDLDISYIYDLTYQFYSRLCNLDVPLNEEGKNYTDLENCIYDKFFELLSELFQAFLQFREKNNHLLLIRTLSQLVQDFYNNLKLQDKIPQIISDILFCDVGDNSYSSSFSGCRLDRHYITKEVVLKVEYCKKDIFYDFFVPYYNCYIGNGIINHNSGKSWFIAHLILEKLMYKKVDVLCAREHQNSIAESNYKLFVKIIDKYKLPFTVQMNKIISRITGATIVFIGLSDITADNVKSYEDFGLVWLEEAQKITQKSWETLNPTIRTEGAQIIITMNPEVSHSKHPIMSELTTMYAEDTLHIHANYYDNPFVSADIKKTAELFKINKPDEYKVIWLGIPDDNSGNRIVKGFSRDNIRPLFYRSDLNLHISCDFNYDPMCWVFFHKTQDKMYVFDELIEEHTSTYECAKRVIERFPNHQGEIIINGDSAGNQRNCAHTNPDMTNFKVLVRELERYYGREIRLDVRRGNPHKVKRFEAFNNMVRRYDGEICFYIDERCKWTIYNIENAMYKEGTREVDEPSINDIKKDRNKKFLIHPLDAVSYPCEFYHSII